MGDFACASKRKEGERLIEKQNNLRSTISYIKLKI
jgi:hypothetical protein